MRAWLKIEPQRSLHHTRRADTGWLPKSRIGLRDQTGGRIECEGQTRIKGLEIRVVEDIVRLPGKPQPTLLSKAEVLEQRQVRVDEAGQAQHIAR